MPGSAAQLAPGSCGREGMTSSSREARAGGAQASAPAASAPATARRIIDPLAPAGRRAGTPSSVGRRRDDELALGCDRLDDLDLLLLGASAAVRLGVAGDAHPAGADLLVADEDQPADHVALFPAHALDVEPVEMHRGARAAPGTRAVVVLLGLAHGLHVLGGGVEAHAAKGTLGGPVSSYAPGILARGPWHTGQVAVRWRDDRYEPAAERTAAADRAIAALEDRGSPAYDGLAARLAGYRGDEDGLTVELQPMRWSLRLAGDDALGAVSVLCVVRSADGRWLAGRRAAWVATWAGRWALGAGGAVEV